MTAYAELVAASNFSFLRGASRPEEMAVAAATLGYKALAICDRNSVSGVVRAHKPAKELGLKYIPGCRLVLQDGLTDTPPRPPFLVAPAPEPGPTGLSASTVLADKRVGPGSKAGTTKGGGTACALEIACLPTDRAAWGRLCRLLTCGNRRAPKAECYLWLDDLIRHGEGQMLILLPPWDAPPPAFAEAARDLAGRFPGHVFIGAALGFDGQDARRLARLAALARETGAPMVAIGDCLYHAPSRKPLQDVVTCIREKCTIAEAGYRLQRNAERHPKHPLEIERLYAGYEQAVARSAEIAAACHFSLDELKYEYPDEPYAPFATPQEALVHHTNEGLKRHYPEGPPEKVAKQVAHELALIEQLNYARYFLTVFDLVRFARGKGILCQGRGSAANSTVCYCLGVTGVNPGEIDLLFERFISAERGEPPDIDIDFEHERREEVIQYVYEKYGRDRAGIVATVITYRAKSSIREVGKVLGLSEEVIGALSGMMWWWSANGVEDKHIREIGLDPADRTLRLAVRLARELSGFPRHLSQHTGGFVITRGSLEEIVPVGNAAMADRTFIEWDKDDLDQLGLLKVDVLALGMLTCIQKSFDLLRTHYDCDLQLATVPWADKAVYDMICRADTVGVFQIESRAQMSMLPRLKPRIFYDLVIEVAIVRPGPIQGDMVHPYLRRRDGKEEVHYPSEKLKGVLEKTLGVPLFQEQAMKIAIVAAGFTPGEADQLRRAMATFRHAGTIQTFGKRLIEGMEKNGYERDFAERCFRQIEGFGEYGFPESHAAAFALLAYVSSWIKCHRPDVFACALLNSQPMGFYAPAQIVRDFRDHDGEARAVDINHSFWDCTLEKRGSQRAPAASSPSPLEGEGSGRRPVGEGYGHIRESAARLDAAPPHPVADAPALSLEGRGQVLPHGVPAISPVLASSLAETSPQAAAGPLSHGKRARVRGGALSVVHSPSPGPLRAPPSPHGDLCPSPGPLLPSSRAAVRPDRDPLADQQAQCSRKGAWPPALTAGATEVPSCAEVARRARDPSRVGAEPAHALRLGFRLVKGLAVEDAEAIVAARGAGYRSLDDFAARTGLPVRKLKLLAEADAFRSIGLDRRQALWAVSRYAETGTPAALLQGLPLFAATASAPLAREAEVALPKMALGEHVLADYIAIRMSLKAHPMALLREDFSPRGYLPSAALRDIPSGRIVKVAGIVLIRQRPGTASGVIFSTIEDETGIANLIIWPKVFEQYRRIVLGARLLGVRGQIQSEQGVIHIVARELFDMSGHLARLAEKSPAAADFLSPGDEVRRSVEDDARSHPPRGSLPPHDDLVAKTLPKGRNFH